MEPGYVQITRALQEVIEKPRLQTGSDRYLFAKNIEPKSAIEDEASSVMDSSVFSMPVQPSMLHSPPRQGTYTGLFY